MNIHIHVYISKLKQKIGQTEKRVGGGGGDKFYHNVNLNVAGMILELR